jgi:general secretion pathway protein K
MTGSGRSRGVALIIALVVVALATIMATRIGAQGALNERRGMTLLAQEQAFQVALGAEAWAIEVLRESKTASPHMDSLDQPWATPLPPIPIDGGAIAGQVEDMQGRFNLNSVVKADGTINQAAFDQFTRILAALDLEPKWAALLLDWIDPDSIVYGISGAEDGVYLGQSPPYRTANRQITSTSELLALPGFGAERYKRLAPYVAALPLGTKLNTCTASGLVLDSLAAGLTQFGGDAAALAANRQKGCFPRVSDVQAALSPLLTAPGQLQAFMSATLVQQTDWFRVRTVVSLGTTQLTLYSLLERNPGGFSRVLLRTLGTE